MLTLIGCREGGRVWERDGGRERMGEGRREGEYGRGKEGGKEGEREGGKEGGRESMGEDRHRILYDGWYCIQCIEIDDDEYGVGWDRMLWGSTE